MSTTIRIIKGSVFYFTDNPVRPSDSIPYVYHEKGMLVIENGTILYSGSEHDYTDTLPDSADYSDHSGKLILPGFIDTHIHYPQTDIIASYGKQLLDWLQTYTFPCEQKFESPDHAGEVADFFIRELIRNGTTSALVLGTIHQESVDAIFQTAEKINMRLIAGKTMMDRNAPSYLLDTTEGGYNDSKKLIDRWHNKNRLLYAVTPRFALTSTEEQLEAAGELFRQSEELYLHTHLAENVHEVEKIATLYPWSNSYLDVYDRYGLTGNNAVFAHGVHLSDSDFERLQKTGSSLSHCPTSNLFLGSGLFDMNRANRYSVKTGLGTDVGGGTSFSILRTMSESYKVCQLKGYSLSSLEAFYLATLGGAASLSLDDRIGSLSAGKEADFIVINPDAIPLLKRRFDQSHSIEEQLFTLMMLGDDRNIQEVYINGRPVKNG